MGVSSSILRFLSWGVFKACWDFAKTRAKIWANSLILMGFGPL